LYAEGKEGTLVAEQITSLRFQALKQGSSGSSVCTVGIIHAMVPIQQAAAAKQISNRARHTVRPLSLLFSIHWCTTL
jgi:hypothetical protein